MNAIITGATKGIGYAIAEIFAQKGISVCVCSRNTEDIDKMKVDFEDRFPDISFHGFKCDVSERESINTFLNEAKEAFNNQVDILVNNAGVFLPGETLKEEEGHLEKMIETNLYSAYHVSRAIVPLMEKAKNGYIINMCSIASKIAYPNGGSYSISKFALLGFSKVLREELKDKGIKVSAILPGATWSNSWANVDLPHERLMEASDIAKVVYNITQLSGAAVLEEVTIRPQLGDL